jgi:hypothetical protein
MSPHLSSWRGMGRMTDEDRRARIRELNDQLRTTGAGGIVLVTRGILDQGLAFAACARTAVAKDTRFSQHNDPYEEHDFGSIEIAGLRLFWKIDYYDLARQFGSPDPADPEVTTRVMTIMRADEY